MTTPLTQLADDDFTQATDALKGRTDQLAASDIELALPDKDAKTVTTALADLKAKKALAALETKEAGIRRELALALLPADAAGLAGELEATLIERQYAVAEAARAADALGAEERKRAALAAAVDAARQTLATAAAAKDKAHEDADRIDAWTSAARSQPVTDALSSARQALTASPYIDARQRLVTLLGRELVEQLIIRAAEADHRDAAVAGRLDRARQARWRSLADRGDPSGVLRSTRQAYSTAVTALRAVAEGAPVRFDRAMRGLATVMDGEDPTQVEQDRMDSLRDGEKGAKAAVAKEKAVWDAYEKLRKAEADLDDAVLARIPMEPAVDHESSQDVADKHAAVVAAQQGLKTAQGELAEVQNALDTWEAAIPDVVMDQVFAFLAADATLRELGDTHVDHLLKAVSRTRDRLVTALRAAAKTAAVSDRLTAEVTARAGDADAWRAVAAARRAALVRGEA
ncbi:hypothetical protein [Streptomyces werraensis]|uniref:hypothetical protein n=1 Tax=Streptomyces werraensis TaxID=68284 RepID=UPI003421A31A